MALGNNFNSYNNNQEKRNSININGIRFNNGESKIDQTAIKFDFWNGMMKISIGTKKTGSGNDEYNQFDFNENVGVAYLTHIKARMLLEDIIAMEADGTFNSVGVNTGSDKLIVFSNGKEFGTNSKFLIIYHIDENGKPTSTYAYEFKNNFYQTIRDYNSKDASYDRSNFPNLEVDQFKTTLEEYYKSATNAMAGSFANAFKYTMDRNYKSLTGICQKLGVDITNGNYSKYNSSSNFFNGNSGGRSNGSSGGFNSGSSSSMGEYEE